MAKSTNKYLTFSRGWSGQPAKVEILDHIPNADTTTTDTYSAQDDASLAKLVAKVNERFGELCESGKSMTALCNGKSEQLDSVKGVLKMLSDTLA